jgi:hypothetical protein
MAPTIDSVSLDPRPHHRNRPSTLCTLAAQKRVFTLQTTDLSHFNPPFLTSKVMPLSPKSTGSLLLHQADSNAVLSHFSTGFWQAVEKFADDVWAIAVEVFENNGG